MILSPCRPRGAAGHQRTHKVPDRQPAEADTRIEEPAAPARAAGRPARQGGGRSRAAGYQAEVGFRGVHDTAHLVRHRYTCLSKSSASEPHADRFCCVIHRPTPRLPIPKHACIQSPGFTTTGTVNNEQCFDTIIQRQCSVASPGCSASTRRALAAAVHRCRLYRRNRPVLPSSRSGAKSATATTPIPTCQTPHPAAAGARPRLRSRRREARARLPARLPQPARRPPP